MRKFRHCGGYEPVRNLSAACTGEEATTIGSLYEVSNQRTLGQSEKEIVNWLQRQRPSSTTRKCGSGAPLLTPSVWGGRDEAYKSYGVLKYARKMSEKDARIFISQLMAGEEDGLMKFNEECSLYSLIIELSLPI